MKKHFLLFLLCLTLLMLAFISRSRKKEETTKQAKPEAVITEQNTNLSDGADNEGIEVKDNSGKRVVCFGDSLTVGTGGEGTTMPDTIAKLSGAEVLN